VFTDGMDFTTGYWVFDGVTGGGPGTPAVPNWTIGFGFKINHSTGPAFQFHGPNITVRHFENQGNGGDGSGFFPPNCALVWNTTGTGDNVTASYFYSHDLGASHIFCNVEINNVVIEYAKLDTFEHDVAEHAEVASIWGDPVNWTFRYNLVTYVDSTGGLMWDNESTTSGWFRIYGNIFYKPSGVTWSGNNGVIGGWTGPPEELHNVLVYNNTFINIALNSLGTLAAIFGGNEAKNNLWYSCTSPDFTKFTTHNYNHFVASGGTHSEANGTSSASGDPFADYVALDFSLIANSSAGTTLGSPYDVDLYGNTRTTWTRGAIEYQGGDDTDPVVIIISPTSSPTTSTSTTPMTTLAGTASDNVALTSVTWSNDRGGSGSATGTTTWSVASITLQSGTNVITVTATDTSSNTGTDTLTVTYTPPAVAVPTNYRKPRTIVGSGL